jgi:hypothetical protein
MRSYRIVIVFIVIASTSWHARVEAAQTSRARVDAQTARDEAEELALPNNSVRCIYAINVFHHLPESEELCRVLHPGGGCILIEPHGGSASAFPHRHMHVDEHFDLTAPTWHAEHPRAHVGRQSGVD